MRLLDAKLRSFPNLHFVLAENPLVPLLPVSGAFRHNGSFKLLFPDDVPPTLPVSLPFLNAYSFILSQNQACFAPLVPFPLM